MHCCLRQGFNQIKLSADYTVLSIGEQMHLSHSSSTVNVCVVYACVFVRVIFSHLCVMFALIVFTANGSHLLHVAVTNSQNHWLRCNYIW
jgi:hypothetical protein